MVDPTLERGPDGRPIYDWQAHLADVEDILAAPETGPPPIPRTRAGYRYARPVRETSAAPIVATRDRSPLRRAWDAWLTLCLVVFLGQCGRSCWAGGESVRVRVESGDLGMAPDRNSTSTRKKSVAYDLGSR